MTPDILSVLTRRPDDHPDAGYPAVTRAEVEAARDEIARLRDVASSKSAGIIYGDNYDEAHWRVPRHCDSDRFGAVAISIDKYECPACFWTFHRPPTGAVCGEPAAEWVKCVVCECPVKACECEELHRIGAVESYVCPVHSEGSELSGGGWVCCSECWDIAAAWTDPCPA